MRPWRKLRVYGYWLMGLTTLLVLIFDLGLEPFATRVSHYWIWGQTKISIDWYGTPLSNFLGWLVTTLLDPTVTDAIRANMSGSTDKEE